MTEPKSEARFALSEDRRFKLGNDTYAAYRDGHLDLWNDSGSITVEPEQLARLLSECGPFHFSASPSEWHGMWWLDEDDED